MLLPTDLRPFNLVSYTVYCTDYQHLSDLNWLFCDREVGGENDSAIPHPVNQPLDVLLLIFYSVPHPLPSQRSEVRQESLGKPRAVIRPDARSLIQPRAVVNPVDRPDARSLTQLLN